MNSKYLVGALVVLVGVGICFFWTSFGTQQKYLSAVKEELGSSSEDNFTRNQECLQMKDNLSIRFETEVSTLGEHSLEQIFYSPKLNTCAYVRYTDKGSGFYYRSLYDVRDDGPSSKPLEQCDSVSPVAIEIRDSYQRLDGNLDNYYKDLSACDSFDSKLEEYKS